MTPEKRKAKSDEKLKALGIAINDYLPLTEPADTVNLKDKDAVCDRAIAALFSIQLALDTANGQYEDSYEVFSGLMEKCGVTDCLNPAEKRVYDNTASQQDISNIVWEYECYWSLAWALGLVSQEELEDADDICNCEKAVHLVSDDIDNFREKCSLRSKEEILDELDFFYRLHWACVQNRIKPDTPIAGMNEEVVMERRRALEWLVSDEEDWYGVSLDT